MGGWVKRRKGGVSSDDKEKAKTLASEAKLALEKNEDWIWMHTAAKIPLPVRRFGTNPGCRARGRSEI